MDNNRQNESAGQLTPLKISDNIESKSTSGVCNAAIMKDGSLYMWGYNDDGQIGNGTRNGTHKSRKKPVKVLEDVKEVNLC